MSKDQREKRRLDASWTAVWWTRDRHRTNHGIVRDASPNGVFVELPGKDLDARHRAVGQEAFHVDLVNLVV
ncbi:MAG: hypothetical protein AAFX94_13475, partial [Myxococcota bacterium]